MSLPNLGRGWPSRELVTAKALELDLDPFIEWFWANHHFTGPLADNGQFDEAPFAAWEIARGIS